MFQWPNPEYYVVTDRALRDAEYWVWSNERHFCYLPLSGYPPVYFFFGTCVWDSRLAFRVFLHFQVVPEVHRSDPSALVLLDSEYILIVNASYYVVFLSVPHIYQLHIPLPSIVCN